MKTVNLQYLEANLQNIATKIEILHIADFCQLIEKHHIKEVFLLEREDSFAIAYHNFLLTISRSGYKNLEDYRIAVLNNFEQAIDYYEAQSLNIKTNESYQLMKNCGVQDPELFKIMESKNFMEGYNRFVDYLKENKNTTLSFKNPHELYTFAKENHFETFDQFFESFQNGFTNLLDHSIAKERGFSLASEYNEALEKGFKDYEIYKEAKDLGIESINEYEKKYHLENDDENCIHDQKVLLLLLNKIDQGKKVSFNKLKSLFEEELKHYSNSNHEFPSWFKVTLKDDDSLIEFLTKNEKAIKIGDYDSDGEFFEIKPLNDRNVVIDASNVAHNSQGSGDSKPHLQNIITMVKFLKKKGFTEIVVIADASLRHKVDDNEKLEELENETTYIVAPAETSADTFLLSMVKSKHCLLISNDTFREYKMKDTWLAANIDYFRLTFMITQDGVIMPELEKQKG
ncbi:NYN domain-containing protein [Flavobacterium sp. RSB2_4_14]|uniref:NYN domain-containing protein n=1 Tax=Flavobacterium sp. RSB2_4_14 TaxID=3447665 RepID=UPI003F3A22CD